MRTPLVAGNWKMNKTVAEARDLVSLMSAKLHEISNVEKVLCPPFLAIPALAEMLGGSGIGLGAAESALGGEGRVHRRDVTRHGEGILPVCHHRSLGTPHVFW